MIVSFAWREWASRGGQVVSPEFETPTEAGQWRLENPPLIDGQGPTLIKLIDGERTSCTPTELAQAYTEFAAAREPRPGHPLGASFS